MDIKISSLDRSLHKALEDKIANKTKPPGSLGMLEDLALQIGKVQGTLTPELLKPSIVVFAGDHGIAESGVSAFPKEVTPQMVLNFLSGGAAINVFCRQNDIGLEVVDAGVDYDFGDCPGLVHAKVAKGTANFLEEAAMTEAQCQTALENGRSIVGKIHKGGSNIVGFGEMGIGNTSSAAVIMSILCDIPIAQCVGRGTGVTDEGLARKISLLEEAMKRHSDAKAPLDVLRTFGGFEIAQICGAMLEAASRGMIVMVDGFIASSAFLVAHKLYPEIIDYSIFCHLSDEQAHRQMLETLDVEPVLKLGMRLGEGSGVAVAYPVIEAAVTFLNDMASFESAGVSDKEDK